MRSGRRSTWGWARSSVIGGLGLAALIAGCATSAPARFQAHIDYLASDELEGRGIGSAGIELAAEYISQRFSEIGLEPAGDDETYFQTFRMTLQRELTDESRLIFTGDPVARRQGKDFIPFSFSAEEAFDGGVVFCGYGTKAPERNHDDFAGVQLKDRVALVLRGEPPDWADEDGSMTRHAMLRNKVYNAKDRGAAGVLIVNQAPGEGESDELADFDAHSADEYGIPAFHVTRALADAQLARAGHDPLDKLQAKLDSGKTASAPLTGVTVSGQAGFKKKSAPTKNVLGLLRGAGPGAEEAVVIGAHYDHLGFRRPMMRKFQAGQLVKDTAEPQIHNGADDNASGVSGLIEIARMFASGDPPRRSVLFIAFTGEESGTHGSKYYVNHPAIPLDQTVAMINLDMIGRMKTDENRVQIFGTECGTEFKEIVEAAGQAAGLDVAPIADPGGASDHGPFVYHKIPAMHFFTGHHRDYHKPTDDADKINPEGGARVAEAVYHAAYDLATRADRPEFHVVKKPKSDGAGGRSGYRVVMGIAPNFVESEQPGMGVDNVNPDGPADLAGMKTGDRIIRINGKEISNIYDYMAATRNNKPGDTVEVIILRDGTEMTLQVTLASSTR